LEESAYLAGGVRDLGARARGEGGVERICAWASGRERERERWPLLIRARAGFRVRVGWPREDPRTRQLVGGVVVVVTGPPDQTPETSVEGGGAGGAVERGGGSPGEGSFVFGNGRGRWERKETRSVKRTLGDRLILSRFFPYTKTQARFFI
jgi:hypothetical protein